MPFERSDIGYLLDAGVAYQLVLERGDVIVASAEDTAGYVFLQGNCTVNDGDLDVVKLVDVKHRSDLFGYDDSAQRINFSDYSGFFAHF